VVKCDTKLMLADPFTKPLACARDLWTVAFVDHGGLVMDFVVMKLYVDWSKINCLWKSCVLLFWVKRTLNV
jgi:hypothetical protein